MNLTSRSKVINLQTHCSFVWQEPKTKQEPTGRLRIYDIWLENLQITTKYLTNRHDTMVTENILKKNKEFRGNSIEKSTPKSIYET